MASQLEFIPKTLRRLGNIFMSGSNGLYLQIKPQQGERGKREGKEGARKKTEGKK